MAGKQIQVQNKIISGAGVKPTVPNPPEITPDDIRWDNNTDILKGQLCYNETDDIWYTRKTDNTIVFLVAQPLNNLTADKVTLDSSTFDKNLDQSITDVQKLAEAVDELTTGGGGDLTPYQLRVEKGQAGGYAGLDQDAKVPLNQLPDIGGNGKIAVSSLDTVQDYLVNKVQAGSNITIATINSGSNEYLLISSTGGSGSGSLVWGTITGTLSSQTDLIDVLNLKIDTAQKAIANGVATLDSSGVIPLSQIPASLIGGLDIKGAWNANTNIPTLNSGVGIKGDLYIVTVAGNTILDGIGNWKIGDSLFFDGTVWQKISGQSVTVASVFGRIGNVIAQTGDYNADQITETANRKFITSSQQNVLTHTSGVNTGDQDLSGFELKNNIDICLNFVQLQTYNLVFPQNWKITSVTTNSGGVTATVKLGGTSTDYTLNNQVNAWSGLDISVNSVGQVRLIGTLL